MVHPGIINLRTDHRKEKTCAHQYTPDWAQRSGSVIFCLTAEQNATQVIALLKIGKIVTGGYEIPKRYQRR